MTKTITLKNNIGLDILRFENIKLMYDKDFKRVAFQLHIEFEFFKAQTLLDAEEHDFINMKECLKKMHKFELKSFIFNPIGEQLNIQFVLQENGQIKVAVRLNDPMFTGKFEFEYLTDQSFIPNLINEIEIILKDSI